VRYSDDGVVRYSDDVVRYFDDEIVRYSDDEMKLCDIPMMKFVWENSRISSSESHTHLSVNSFVSQRHWVRAWAAILYAMRKFDFDTLSS